jgi:cytochrome d ubiquinol oxidase subunit II
MAEFWFGVLATTLIIFSVLDGFDFGAGALTLYLGKTEGERRAVISAIGPFWDGNEVWLIASGGILFLAFPSVLAAAFPAFYLALFLVLWCLILRGIAMEVRSHVTDPMWRSFWDVVLTLGSGLLALLFGVALGNVVRGMPIGGQSFTLAFFTNFLPSGNVGLLDWYTVSVGLLSFVALLAHGAAFLTYRTEGSLRAAYSSSSSRSKRRSCAPSFSTRCSRVRSPGHSLRSRSPASSAACARLRNSTTS